MPVAGRRVWTAIVVAVIALMTVGGLFLAVWTALGGPGFALGPSVARIEVEGLIADDEELLEQIRRFRDDPTVRGFLIAINSPGGVVGPSQSIYRELRRLREEDERPVVATIGAVGASGGYYVALGADSIYALPGSITGSIGVIMQFPDASRLMDRMGVQVEVVQSAEHKDAGSPFRPMTEADRAVLAELVDDVYRQFVEVVAEERGLSAEVVGGLADGRILTGRQALDAGLIDRLGNSSDALAALGRMAGLGDEPRVVHPPEERPSMLDLLLNGGLSAVGRALAGDGAGMPRLEYVVPWMR